MGTVMVLWVLDYVGTSILQVARAEVNVGARILQEGVVICRDRLCHR